MFLLLLCLTLPMLGETGKEILVESPFYLRARLLDSQTAHVQFEIARNHTQRLCQRYQFTIRRNRQSIYSMPEQNLTFWRNSLDLKHLPVGRYRVCAMICSEFRHQTLGKKPVSSCVTFDAYRPHFLILTLYILVLIFLIVCQIIFTLRKREIQTKIRLAVEEVENLLSKWRHSERSDRSQTLTILQNLVSSPLSPPFEDYETLNSLVYHFRNLRELERS